MSRKPAKVNKTSDNAVTQLRKRLSLTQEQFAEKLDVSEKYISMLETGKRNPSDKLARKMLSIAPPGTRLEWIKGLDNYETELDLFKQCRKEGREKSYRLGIFETEFLKLIANHAGYSFIRQQKTDTKLIPGYIFVDKDEDYTVLDYFGENGIEELWNDILDYSAFRLRRFIEKENYKKIEWRIEGETDGKES